MTKVLDRITLARGKQHSYHKSEDSALSYEKKSNCEFITEVSLSFQVDGPMATTKEKKTCSYENQGYDINTYTTLWGEILGDAGGRLCNPTQQLPVANVLGHFSASISFSSFLPCGLLRAPHLGRCRHYLHITSFVTLVPYLKRM